MGVIKVKAMCIVVREGRDVLVGMGHDEAEGQSFGRLIGGHVEFGELAEDAVRREFREELGTELENLEFVRVVENVFTYNGQPGHEVVFLYRGSLADRSLYGRDSIPIADSDAVAAWMPIADIESGAARLYPSGADQLL